MLRDYHSHDAKTPKGLLWFLSVLSILRTSVIHGFHCCPPEVCCAVNVLYAQCLVLALISLHIFHLFSTSLESYPSVGFSSQPVEALPQWAASNWRLLVPPVPWQQTEFPALHRPRQVDRDQGVKALGETCLTIWAFFHIVFYLMENDGNITNTFLDFQGQEVSTGMCESSAKFAAPYGPPEKLLLRLIFISRRVTHSSSCHLAALGPESFGCKAEWTVMDVIETCFEMVTYGMPKTRVDNSNGWLVGIFP